MKPSQIATALQASRPDLAIYYEPFGGGNISVLVAERLHGNPQTVYFGVASGDLGWSTEDGEHNGIWHDIEDIYDAWLNDTAIRPATALLVTARIAATLTRQLPSPPRFPLDYYWKVPA